MNLKHATSAGLALLLGTLALSAQAVQTDIKVWADVDPTLALLQADGSPLPDTVRLTYNPSIGLLPWSQQVRIYSNDISKDLSIRLANAPVLSPLGGSASSVPLSVSINTRRLGVVPQDFTAVELFDGALPGASIAMPLQIAQATLGRITTAGQYEGMVSVVIVQKP